MWMIGLRYDLFYAVKELSRSLTGPTQIDSARLRHVLRYLKGSSNVVTCLRPKHQFVHGSPMDIKVFTDSDWAGCSKTRKSTSGVVLQVLGCTVAALSRTQHVLALSSGEAELYAMGTGVFGGTSSEKLSY